MLHETGVHTVCDDHVASIVVSALEKLQSVCAGVQGCRLADLGLHRGGRTWPRLRYYR